jgi:hypothetical protein
MAKPSSRATTLSTVLAQVSPAKHEVKLAVQHIQYAAI